MTGAPLGSTYTLGDRLGAGAMGTVYRGADREGNGYAIKVLRPEFAEDQGLVQQFVQERSALTRVDHPNVVRVQDLVIEGGTLALVTDLVEGGDLRQYLEQRGTLPPAEVAGLVAGIAAGLGAVHAAGLVHRDVKPENVLIDQSSGRPVPRVSDFGIARLADASAVTRSSMLVGTPNYVAPEVADGRPATGAADIYSLGILAYELCCGVSPFEGGSQLAVIRRHGDAEAPRPHGIPDQLWAVLREMLLKDPQRRPTAAQVGPYLASLTTALQEVPAAPRLTEPLAIRPTERLPEPAPAPTPTPAPAAEPAPDRTPPPETWTATPSVAPVSTTESLAGGLSPDPEDAETPRKRRGALVVGLAVAALVLTGGGFFAAQRFLGGDDDAPGTAAADGAGGDQAAQTDDGSAEPDSDEATDDGATDEAETDGEDTNGGDSNGAEANGDGTDAAAATDATTVQSGATADESGGVSSAEETEEPTEEAEPAVMPDVVDGSLALARTELRGVTIEVVEEFDTASQDNWVLAQSIAAGEAMPDEVTLTVSKRPVTVYLESLSSVASDNMGSEVAELDGESYPRSLVSNSWWPDGYREWNLSRGYRELVATVGRSDDASNASETVQVEVFLDQRKVWSERAVLGDPIEMEVDVTDALRLRIEYTSLDGAEPDLVLGDIHLLGLPGEVPEPEDD